VVSFYGLLATVKMIKDNLIIFLNSIKGGNTDEVDELFEDLISSAGEYITSLICLQAGIVCGRATKVADEYREYILKLHNKKDECQSSFVNNIKIINRFLKNSNFPLLFEGDDENKSEVEKFALTLVSEFATAKFNYVNI